MLAALRAARLKKWSKFKCCVLWGSVCTNIFSVSLYSISSKCPKSRLSSFFILLRLAYSPPPPHPFFFCHLYYTARKIQRILVYAVTICWLSDTDSFKRKYYQIYYSPLWMHLASSTSRWDGEVEVGLECTWCWSQTPRICWSMGNRTIAWCIRGLQVPNVQLWGTFMRRTELEAAWCCLSPVSLFCHLTSR